MKRMKTIIRLSISLMLAACLIQGVPIARVHALAPSTSFRPISTDELLIESIQNSAEFKLRARTFQEILEDDVNQTLFHERAERLDKIALAGLPEAVLSFDYHPFPLGPDSIYMKARIRNGPDCYCVLSGTKKPRLLDEKDFLAELQLQADPLIYLPLLRPAIDKFREQESGASLAGGEEARIRLANRLFRSLPTNCQFPEAWILFMMQTALKGQSVEVQAAAWLLHKVFLAFNVVTFSYGTFKTALYGDFSYSPSANFEMGRKKSINFMTLDVYDKRILAEKFMAASGLNPQQRRFIECLSIGSPWATAAFFPVPEWVQEKGCAETFVVKLDAKILAPQMLERIARRGALDGYRSLLESMEAGGWGKGQSIAYLLEKILGDLGYLDQVHGALADMELADYLPDPEEEEPAIPVQFASEPRVADYVYDPPVHAAGTFMLAAREVMQTFKRVEHDTRAPLSTLLMLTAVLKDSLEKMKTGSQALSSDQQAVLMIINQFEAFLQSLNTTIGEAALPVALVNSEQAQVVLLKATIFKNSAREELNHLAGLSKQLIEELNKAGMMTDICGRVPGRIQQMQEVVDLFMGETPHLPQWTDLGAEINEDVLKDQFSPGEQERLLKEDKVKVKIIKDPGLPKGWAHPVEFKNNIFAQLVRNAVQAMEGSGELEVRLTKAEGGRIRLIVTDTGPGIPLDILSRIYLPQFSTKAKVEGKERGVGLDTTFATVERYGGRIWAESTPGKGTTFIVELPSQESFEARAIGDRTDFVLPAQLAALEVLRLLGDGRSEAVRKFAEEEAEATLATFLEMLPIDGKILSDKDEGDLACGENIGRGGMKVMVMADALLQTRGVIERGAGTQIMTLFAQPDGIMEVPPELYMRKLIVGKEAAKAHIDVRDSAEKNLERIAAAKGGETKVENLKGAVLFKSRHKSLIRDIARAGVPLSFPDGRKVDPFNEESFESFWEEMKGIMDKGHDVWAGNIKLLARKDVEAVEGLVTGKIDFVYGADGAEEAIFSAALVRTQGGAMSAQLVSRESLADGVEDADVQDPKKYAKFSRKEIAAAKKRGFFVPSEERVLKRGQHFLDQVYSANDLVNSSDMLLVMTAVTDSLWVDALKGIQLDPATGNKTARSLVASKRGPARVIETVLQGHHMEYQRRISAEKDRKKKAALLAEYAYLLQQDGRFQVAIPALELAYGFDPKPEYQASLKLIRALQMLVNIKDRDGEDLSQGAEAAAQRLMKSAFEISSNDRLGLFSLYKKLQPRQRLVEIKRDFYRFEYDRETGTMELLLQDRVSEKFYAIPLFMGLTCADGRRIGVQAYKKHDVIYAADDEVIIKYSQPMAIPDLPEITVRFRFPKDSPTFSVRLQMHNTTENPIALKEWRTLYSNVVDLGENANAMRFFGKFSDLGLGSWVNLDSRMGLAMGFDQWQKGGKHVSFGEGNVTGFLASSDAHDVVPPDGKVASEELRVFVRPNLLNMVSGYAFWKGAHELRSPAEPVLENVITSLGLSEPELNALVTAMLISETPPDNFAPPDILPQAFQSDPGSLVRLSQHPLKEVDTAEHEHPSLFVMDLGPGNGKLVALFNIYGHPTEWELKFKEHLQLDPHAEYTVFDYWANGKLGEDHGYKVVGGYKFKGPETLPVGGVKFLRITPVGGAHVPLSKQFDELAAAGSRKDAAL